MKLARIALRNIGRNRRRSILSATATAIATMSLVAMSGYINGLLSDIQRNVGDLVTGHVRIRHADYDRNEQLTPLHLRVERPEELLALLDREPDVRAAVARQPLPVGVFRGDETVGAMAIGMDMQREQEFMHIDGMVASGRLPEAGKNQIAVGTGLAAKLGVVLGSRLTLLSTTMRRSSNAMTFDVVGILDFPIANMNGAYMLLPLDRATALARMDDAVTEILVKAKDESRIPALRADISQALADGGWTDLKAWTWTEENYILGMLQMVDGIYLVMAVVFVLLASTVLVNTTMMVVFERTREIGTVGALGMKGREIVRMFLIEAMYLASIGAVAGVLLGLAIAVPLAFVGVNMGALTESIDFQISQVVMFQPRLTTVLLILLYAVVISCIAAYVPARRAAKIQPVEALRAI